MDSRSSSERGLRLSVLGSPQVEWDGVPIEVDTRKATALLVYLAVTGRPQGRDALAGLLWPDLDQERARAALRRTLSALKKALGGRWLAAGRAAVALEGDDIWIDVHRFSELERSCFGHGHDRHDVCPECVTPLEEATALFRGDFMAGFTLRDSAAFDEWQFFQAEGLRRELAGALERLVRALVAVAEIEQAIDHARRWLALDPLHEPAHRTLMRLYAWSDRRSAALRQFRNCVGILDRELGVPPLEETSELYRAIVGGTLAPPNEGAGARVAPTSPPPSNAPLPGPGFRLVGRDDDLGAVLQVYRTLTRDGRLVVLEGEAGIGKSMLAEAVIAELESDGAHVLAARCYEGETALPYGPVAELLRAALAAGEGWADAVSSLWLGEAARLVPEVAELRPGLVARPDLDDPGARSRLFEGVVRVLLAAVRGDRPGILFIDDLHWADESSLDVVTYLARRLAGKPILLLGTWRPEELVRHPRLQAASLDATRAGRGLTVRLGRLTEQDVRELAAGWAPGGVEEALVERLYRETQGLPLFVREYLAAVAPGSDGLPWPPPRGVKDLVEARVAALSEASSQLLAAAAVIGSAFEFETLRNASGRSEDEAVGALEELIRSGLLRERLVVEAAESSATYDFAHEVVRALVYEETGFARKRLLHARVAHALVGRAGPSDAFSKAGQAARHYQAAGRDGEAARWFKVAGEEAKRLYANAEALAHFDSALALGHPDVGPLHEAIGDLHTLGGDYEAAAASYEAAAARSEASSLARLEQKLGNIHLRSGDWAAAEGHYETALAFLTQGEDAALRARVLADRSLARHRRGDDGAAMALAREALAVAEVVEDTLALAQVHNILGILATGDEAVEQLEASLSYARASDDVTARVAALNNLALAQGARGELERALELARKALELCSAQGDLHRQAALENNLADLLHARGDSEEAMVHLKRAVALFAEVGDETLARPELWKLVEW